MRPIHSTAPAPALWSCRTSSSSDSELLDVLHDHSAGAGAVEWIGLIEEGTSFLSVLCWGRRMVQAATQGVPGPQTRRLAVLLDSDSRPQAFEKLRMMGDLWSKSSVTMTLTRYSEKIDAYLQRTLWDGPQGEEDRQHWSFLEKLAGMQSHPGPEYSRSSLAWLIH